MRPRVTRRSLLLGALPAAAAHGAPPAQPATPWLATLATRAAAAGLLLSYDTLGFPGATDFDRAHTNCAYTYDNAVAGLALLAAGQTTEAARLAESLVQAQSRDRFYSDGRLRNAYAAGLAPQSGPYPLAGWWDPAQSRWLEDAYQAGSSTGVVAWAMLLWIGLAYATGDATFTRAANRAGDWVAATQRAARGYAGGIIGFETQPQKLTWVSTEHNTDLQAAYTALHRTADAAHAATFVASMWNPAQARFFSGLRPDGTTNDHSAVDANLWPLLVGSPDTKPRWRPALDTILTQHGLPPGAPANTVQGVDFNNDRDGIWLEGTAITALACTRAGRPAQAARLLATLRANTSPGGLVYATTTPTLTTGLSTGLDTHAPDFLYYRRPHIAPTAWAVLAELNANPFPER